MAKAKKTTRKKTAAASSSSTGNKVGVLIELKVPKQQTLMGLSASSAMSIAANLGIDLDPDFTPVSVTPSTSQREAMLAANQDNTHMLVRAEVSESSIAKLKANPDVVEVWTDAKIEPFACPIPPCDCTPTTPKGNITDVANYLGVNNIWSLGKRGEGIVVGVVDGGITATGRPLAAGEAPARTINNVIGGWPVADWGTRGASWGYHGNMCSTDVLGMAPNCRIYDLRIASASGTSGTISNAILAYDWAIAQHRNNGTPHILSNSWGVYQKAWALDYATNANHPFTRKVVEALNEGIIILFAAGNCGDTCPSGNCSTDNGPGKSIWGANGHPRVMTVGGVNKNEQFIGYSSQGPASLDPHKPDFCSISHFTGYTNSDNGTSAATPIAAGVVALIKQGKPSASHNTIKQALIDTAKNIGPAGWDQHSGAGIIHGKRAYDRVVGTKKLEIKEGKEIIKERKLEKIEIKEGKIERKELIKERKEIIKERKLEKIEVKEIKERKEFIENPKRFEVPIPRIPLPHQDYGQASFESDETASLKQRVENLEQVLSSFISTDLRPDLSEGALSNEAGYDDMQNDAQYAQQQKFEMDNVPS